MIKGIIFDLDGTLLNTIEDLAASTNYALRNHGFPEHAPVAYRYFVGNGITRLIERALPEDARQEEMIKQVREEFVTYYQQHKTDFSQPYPGIPELLENLRQRNILLAVASNKYQQGTSELIRHFFGDGLFAVVSGQKKNIPAKPDPTIVNDILRQTGMEKSQVLYVGDSGVDMLTARNSGLTSIGVSWGFRPRQELEENGACHLIDHPRELLDYLTI